MSSSRNRSSERRVAMADQRDRLPRTAEIGGDDAGRLQRFGIGTEALDLGDARGG
jgi:hypothetical protein